MDWSLCTDCQYCGDKHSFPEPNCLIDVDPGNQFIKHYYCCCGDCDFYEQDIADSESATMRNVSKC